MTPQQTVSDWPPPDTEGFALPNKLSDSGERPVNGRPTLWRVQSLLDVALFERREREGAVSPRTQRFGADGFLAKQGGRGGGEDFILAAVWVLRRLLFFLYKRQTISSRHIPRTKTIHELLTTYVILRIIHRKEEWTEGSAEVQTFVPGKSPWKGALLKDTRALTLRGNPWLSSEGVRRGSEPTVSPWASSGCFSK